eukprot:2685509-Heterocapsa_arctica.AAC.1
MRNTVTKVYTRPCEHLAGQGVKTAELTAVVANSRMVIGTRSHKYTYFAPRDDFGFKVLTPFDPARADHRH